MELRYRCTSYAASAFNPDGKEIGQVGSVLGTRIGLRRYPFQVWRLGHKSVEMSYYGVRYTR
ncbi:MAG: hypothetical protein ICV77_05445 [Cyanobacteria bacterium Co-bin8]|nr:hypothetical protein [Cyanobacteria bacterium Co-bin8]